MSIRPSPSIMLSNLRTSKHIALSFNLDHIQSMAQVQIEINDLPSIARALSNVSQCAAPVFRANADGNVRAVAGYFASDNRDCEGPLNRKS